MQSGIPVIIWALLMSPAAYWTCDIVNASTEGGAAGKSRSLQAVLIRTREVEASTHKVIKFGVAKILEITIDKSIQIAAQEMLAFSVGGYQTCHISSFNGGARV